MKKISLLVLTTTLATVAQFAAQQMPRDLAATQIDSRQGTTTNPSFEIPATQLDQRDPGAANAPFDVEVRDQGLKALLSNMAKDNGLNLAMPPELDRKVTLDLGSITFADALDAILTPLDLQYEIKGKILRVSKEQPIQKIFDFDYVNAQRSSSSSLSASATAGFSGGAGGVGGGGVSGGSATSISGSQNTNVMQDIQTLLREAMSKSGGDFYMDKMTGTIVVNALPSKMAAVQSIIDHYQNKVNRQVVITARFIEVQLNDKSQEGINWTAVLGNVATVTSSLAQASSFNVTLSHKGITALVENLRTQGKVNVISNPQITTLNYQPAVIRDGAQDVFFQTTTQVDPRTGTLLQTASTPATVQEGVVLYVTPSISNDDIISMDINPTITERTGTATSPKGDTAPLTNVRETNTIVRVANGDTIVIAGLISSKTIDNKQGVPGLRSIPVFGALFRNTTQENTKTDLVILLTPEIQTIRTIPDSTEKRLESIETLRQEPIGPTPKTSPKKK